jgi:hypothetical protein
LKNAFQQGYAEIATLGTEGIFQDAMLDFPNVEINSVLEPKPKIITTSSIDAIAAGTRQMTKNQFLNGVTLYQRRDTA